MAACFCWEVLAAEVEGKLLTARHLQQASPCMCSLLLQGVEREDGRVTALQGRLAPSKAAGDTNLKLTWLADVSVP